ncbi:hypothetical protein ABEB36_012251 [Hypothenemus hampei]|uniref:Peroxisomal ATPase PEX1 n=1 Tax=Hypothenemus hampei TaxID=57062 RepID=A0ABD1EAT7_HYPHA
MSPRLLKVKYVTFKNCFVYLSPNNQNFHTGACIQLTDKGKDYFFSATVINNVVKDSYIGINGSYARTLGIEEDIFVEATLLNPLPVVNRISVQPWTKADYDVLELLAQNVQSNLLDQVRVVNKDQRINIWIGNNLSVTVDVVSVEPISPGTLDFLTEVDISAPNASQKDIRTKTTLPCLENFLSTWNYEPTYFRLIPLSDLPKNPLENSNFPFKAYIYPNNFIENNGFYTASLLNKDKSLCLKICFLENCSNDHKTSNIFVHNDILSQWEVSIGARVALEKVTEYPVITKIIVYIPRSSDNLMDKVKECLEQYCTESLVLNTHFPLKLTENEYYSLSFEYDKIFTLRDCCIFMNKNWLNQYTFKFLESSCVTSFRYFPQENFRKADFCPEIFTEIIEQITQTFCHPSFTPDNVIISGRNGTGKTALITQIAAILSGYPYFVKCQLVECKSLKGKSVESLQKVLHEAFASLTLMQPSLLILDDFHLLCHACEEDDHPNSIQNNRVSEMFFAELSGIQRVYTIGILVSTDSLRSLNKHIYKSRGYHLFKHIFKIKDLNKDDRITMLKHMFSNIALDYQDLSVKTDGSVVQDFKDLYQKSLFEASKQKMTNIEQKHCDVALEKLLALSLSNVKLHKSSKVSFENIGGLQEVKNTLTRSILWPLKYSSIFSNAPLKLQSGVLLYGPPGCGKTLLAGALSKEFDLKLIAVKGPELLSKYIGASEENVRDVFENAQKIRPCILFFDEFDSLAPRRGHDNTGVTDRIVNQLLTQLDGIEALQGVCVVAATSRPDLLDPALLRPGRLDKQLLCPMPNENGRVEILQTLSANLQLEDDVDFREIAKQTDGFAGADLQSLLYTAQILDLNSRMEKADEVLTKLTQGILSEALKQTRPSLTKADRYKYDLIYKKFGNNEEFVAGSKVTLA